MKAITGPDGLARCPWAAGDPMLTDYHDTEWGLPVHGERELFERVSLEGFQAGLSWRTILAKREAFREAFDGFDPEVVARYSDAKLAELGELPGIVRNRAKIEAARGNARAVIALRADGGLERFIAAHAPAETPEPKVVADVPTQTADSARLAKALRARGFRFVGPTSMYALMEAIGLVDTHLMDCHRRGSRAGAAQA